MLPTNALFRFINTRELKIKNKTKDQRESAKMKTNNFVYRLKCKEHRWPVTSINKMKVFISKNFANVKYFEAKNTITVIVIKMRTFGKEFA